MHVYKLLLKVTGSPLERTVDFEAKNDAEAADLIAHYYADQDAELWQGERFVGRYGPTPEEGE